MWSSQELDQVEEHIPGLSKTPACSPSIFLILRSTMTCESPHIGRGRGCVRIRVVERAGIVGAQSPLRVLELRQAGRVRRMSGREAVEQRPPLMRRPPAPQRMVTLTTAGIPWGLCVHSAIQSSMDGQSAAKGHQDHSAFTMEVLHACMLRQRRRSPLP